MRDVIEVGVDEVMPDDAAVLRRLEVPGGAFISPTLRALLQDSGDRFARTARPLGVFQSIAKDRFELVFRGEGRNAVETPLDLIYPHAAALALFVATIGPAVESEVQGLFAAGDPAVALVLDAFASEATNRLAEALAERFGARVAGQANSGLRVLPYSPGYCGWHVSGQRALFAAIDPGDIGVTLRESNLMMPIKSVSGVLIAGAAAVHRFKPAWTFCDECRTHDCGPRMASVR